MDITKAQYESIQRYLDGAMSEPEKRVFAEQLATDPLLNRSLLFEQQLRENLERLQTEEEMATFFLDEKWEHEPSEFDDPAYVRSLIEKTGKEWRDENRPKELSGEPDVKEKNAGKVVRFSSWARLAAAACLLVITGTVVWYISRRQEAAPVVTNRPNRVDTPGTGTGRQPEIVKKLPQDTGVPDKNKIDVPKPPVNYSLLARQAYRRDTVPAEKPQLLRQHLEDFATGDYAGIQNLDLDRLPESRGPRGINDKQNVRELGYYYKGLAFLETGNNKAADDNLQWVVDSAENRQLATKAEWYLALAYLKQNNFAKGEPLLIRLAEARPPTPYRKQAERILHLSH